MTPEEKKNALRNIARRANDEVNAKRRSSPALSCDEISRPILNGCMPLIKQLGLTPSHLYVEIGILNGYKRSADMPEIIDQANELEELQREAAIAKCRINHNAVSATHCRDCGEEIPERRRELVAGCQRCADCQEDEELRGKHRR